MMNQMNVRIPDGMKMLIIMKAKQYGCTQAEYVRWCIANTLDKKEEPALIAVTKSLAEY